MPLERVTLTGADESVDPEALVALSQEFPFCEFGILLSSRQYRPRYPGWDWILQLQQWTRAAPPPLALALHLCGQPVRDVLGGQHVAQRLGHWLDGFARIQLNVPAALQTALPAQTFATALEAFGPRQLIFQLHTWEEPNYFSHTRTWGAPTLDCVALYDASGGRGWLPETWPQASAPWCQPWCGYAGGLGPDTLAAQLPRILEAAGEVPIWIDMETGVRTAARFDLAKVRQVLELAAPYVALQGPVDTRPTLR